MAKHRGLKHIFDTFLNWTRAIILKETKSLFSHIAKWVNLLTNIAKRQKVVYHYQLDSGDRW